MKKPKATELKVKDILKLSTKENYFEFLEQSKDYAYFEVRKEQENEKTKGNWT